MIKIFIFKTKCFIVAPDFSCIFKYLSNNKIHTLNIPDFFIKVCIRLQNVFKGHASLLLLAIEIIVLRIRTKKILFYFIIDSLWELIFVELKEFISRVDWRQMIFRLLKNSLFIIWLLIIITLFELLTPSRSYLFLYRFLIRLIILSWLNQ